MKKTLEIERCGHDCKHYSMVDKRLRYCWHRDILMDDCKARKIPLSKITDKKPFPDWCPLEDRGNSIQIELLIAKIDVLEKQLIAAKDSNRIFCPDCGNYYRTPGNGVIVELCECVKEEQQ